MDSVVINDNIGMSGIKVGALNSQIDAGISGSADKSKPVVIVNNQMDASKSNSHAGLDSGGRSSKICSNHTKSRSKSRKSKFTS